MRTIIALILLVAAATAGAEIYRWVDASGAVHYTDRPVEGAETIELPGAQTYSSRAARAAPRRGIPQPPREPAPPPYELAISQPQADQVLWNTGGQLGVLVNIRPALQSGHKLVAYLDGEAALEPPAAAFSLQDVFRGTHSLQVAVVDRRGRELVRSESTTFHVRQTSVVKPP